MKKIFALALAILFCFGCVGGVEGDMTASRQAPALAGSVTVAIPLQPPLMLSRSLAYPPINWGFFIATDSDRDAYVPLALPVGATIAEIKGRVLGGQFNSCGFALWSMPDFWGANKPPLAESTKTVGATVPLTLTLTTNTVVNSLEQYFLTLHNYTGVTPCQMMAAEATYIPAL